MKESVSVWYLYHSGFTVRIRNYLLIFDYYSDEPEGAVRSLSTGVINPDEIKDLQVLVFSSHKHPDHFNPVILDWKQTVPGIRYILSSDISKRFHEDHIIIKPNQTITTPDDISITTLKSTDAGVAFLVELFGVTIYHAGDLNWWHWEEEDKAWNNNMAARYKNELEKLKGKTIDIAFLTCDPRQGASAFWGLEYFMEKIGAKAAFPMHFEEDYSLMATLEKLKNEKSYLSPVRTVSHRGEAFVLTL